MTAAVSATQLTEAEAAAIVRAARVLERNGFGHHDSQRAAHALADAGLLTEAELAATRADLVTALELLHQRGIEHDRLLVDNIRLHRQRIDVGT